MAERKWRETTRDGTPVRLYAHFEEGDYPIHGAIKRDGVWDVNSWTKSGEFYSQYRRHNFDLIPLREPSAEAVEASLAVVAAQEWMKAKNWSIPRATIAAMLHAAYAIDGIEPAGE